MSAPWSIDDLPDWDAGGGSFVDFAGRLTEAVCCKDLEARFVYANDAALRAIDVVGVISVVGQRLSEVCPNPASTRIEEHDHAVMASGQTTVMRESFIAAGSTRNYHVTRMALRDGSGKVCGLVCLAVAERSPPELEDPESRVRDQILSTISHELRSPLNAIQSWTNVLEAQIPADPPPLIARALGGIKKGIGEQVELIEELTDATRIMSGRQSLNSAVVDLAPVIEAAISSVGAAARGVEIVVRLDGARQRVHCDPERVRQCVQHLLENALQFSPPQGVVHVVLDRVGSTARLRVSDQGRRIDASAGSAMFESLRSDASVSKGSLGLGLLLARRLTELQGGQVAASSPAEGEGASFELRFPLAVDPDDAASN